ncbi:twitch domain-containing radical SAM protein [Haliscomenobacter sp.]|uniref:twitch domain-containing radical SAM protein n=1 Tax=Haliscomenobacter sp. TaxID=2717303 RepID=UPI003365144F
MSNFYCAAPWRGLHINPQGNVKTCCAGNPNMLGNLNANTIEEILNTDLMTKIRASLAQGRPHEYCSNCVQAERFGADSERQWHNRVNPNFDYAAAGDRYHYPVIFDVRWNITCNLSCNYCGPSCSSKWASINGVPFKSGTRPYYEQVCEFLEQHGEHIHEVALVGGEPLLLPENDRLLDVIPESTIITLITNMSVDLEKNKIFQKLAQRRNVGWSMSFDNVGDRFEYVRHGADWRLLQDNLQTVKYLMHNNGHWGGIHAVYNIYSATRLCEFRQFAQDTNTTVLWQNLFYPDYLDPFQHGPEVADLATQEIERFSSMDMVTTPAERQFFDLVLTKYSQSQSNPGIQQKFRQHIHDNETVFHPDKAGEFARLWPELVI